MSDKVASGRKRIFISCVSREFEKTVPPAPPPSYPGLRSELRHHLAAKYDVAVQEDFAEADEGTIEKLANLIRGCSVVIHLVGEIAGARVDAKAVAGFLKSKDGATFLEHHAELRAELDECTDLTYSQWEAYLALHFGVSLRIYATEAGMVSQLKHLQRLKLAEKYPAKQRITGAADLYGQLIGDIHDIFASGSTPPEPPFQVRSHRGALTRRTSVRDRIIKAVLDDERTGPVLLYGMGGVGKTTLAEEVCREVRGNFPDGVLVAELGGMSGAPLNPRQAMMHIVKALNPEIGAISDDRVPDAYRRTLEGKRLLILLDDANDHDVVKQVLTGAAGRVTFLITSRKLIDLDEVFPIRVKTFSRAKSRKLLLDIGVKHGTFAELDLVADACGRLPLALWAAGTFLARHSDQWTVRQYLAVLAGQAKRDDDKSKVRAVLEFSARDLVENHPALAKRWQMLAAFPADFDAPAAAAVWQAGEGAELAAMLQLTELCDFSLVEHLGSGRYRLHDLLRPIARRALRGAAAAKRLASAELRFARHYRRVLEAAERVYKGHRDQLVGKKLYDDEEVNIRHGRNWAWNHRSNAEAADLCRQYPISARGLLDVRLAPKERIAWLEQARDAAPAISPPDEANILAGLGRAKVILGDPDGAIRDHEKQLEVAATVDDRNRDNVRAYALSNLGLALLAKGIRMKSLNEQSKTYLNRAIVCLEERLDLARRYGDRHAEGFTHGNLGRAFLELGDPKKALEYQKIHFALASQKEIHDPRGVGTALTNMGLAIHCLAERDASKRGEYLREAIDKFRESLTLRIAIGFDLGRGETLFFLALALRASDEKSDEAIDKAHEALTILEGLESAFAKEVRSVLAAWNA